MDTARTALPPAPVQGQFGFQGREAAAQKPDPKAKPSVERGKELLVSIARPEWEGIQ